MRLTIFLTCLCAGLVLHVIAIGAAQTMVRVAELSLRQVAIKTVMPEYPAEAKKRGAKGVAVAGFVFNGKGEVIEVEILEAPHPLIADAVANAVRQWKFQPQTVKGEPVYIKGKLTFYYVIDERGEGHVNNPRQVN